MKCGTRRLHSLFASSKKYHGFYNHKFMNEENLTFSTKILNFILMLGIAHVSSKRSYICLLVAFAITRRTTLSISMWVCESKFESAFDVFQLTLRLPVRIYLYKK
jgi:hypothetical protein